MVNALIIDEKDNVAVIDKVAIKGIKKSNRIIKYGKHIGISATDIKVGEHVHVHNVESIEKIYRRN